MIDPGEFAEYTGFTEDEVKILCKKYGRDFEKAKQWYNGYSFSNTKAIYNPNSIMQCMTSSKYQNYWTRTESYESLKSYIDMDFEGIKQDLIQMIGGEECKVDTNSFQNDFISLKTKNDVFTLLIHLGYLAFNSENNTVHIPNNEIREEFVLAVKDGSRKEIAKLISSSEELIEFTLEEKSDKVASLIEKVHSQATSPTFYNNKQALRSTIRFAYIAVLDDYVEIQELPSGKGYADIVYIPKKTSDKPALIIELKWNKSSEGALNQIKQNNYPEIVKQLSGDVLLFGINYDERTKNHKCNIEKLKK